MSNVIAQMKSSFSFFQYCAFSSHAPVQKDNSNLSDSCDIITGQNFNLLKALILSA